MNYEQNIKELNEIIAKLATEQLSLAESVSLYERAEQLYKDCAIYLNEQSGKVFKIKQEIEKFDEEQIG